MKEELKTRLQEQLNPTHLEVSEEGGHYHVLVVSDVFQGLMPVKRQQSVYSAINELIVSGQVHAVHIKAKTPEEFQA